MWIKVIGALMIIFAGISLGFIAAFRFNERPRQIRQLQSCLTSLKTYINYTVMPLPEALAASCEGINGPVRDFFSCSANMLAQNPMITPQQAFVQSILQLKGQLLLEQPELDLLTTLGANLGKVNCEEQEKYLDMVSQQLANIEIEAVQTRDENVKMCRYLGICGGLLIVIVLV